MTTPTPDLPTTPTLRCAPVLGLIDEDTCDVWTDGRARPVAITPLFPTPRADRISSGHLVAVATSAEGVERVVWRWFDAVVLGPGDDVGEDDDQVRLWEPFHGIVRARPRPSYTPLRPGERAWASAGLPGAEWWVAAPVSGASEEAEVDVEAVRALYADHDLWGPAFG